MYPCSWCKIKRERFHWEGLMAHWAKHLSAHAATKPDYLFRHLIQQARKSRKSARSGKFVRLLVVRRGGRIILVPAS
jgi:hypothetical protein